MKAHGKAKYPEAWLMLFLVCLATFLMFGGLVFISPILESVRNELAISYAEIGLIFSIPIGILALLSLPGGYMADKIGSGKSVGIGIAVLGGSTILRGLSPNFSFLLVASILYGVGLSVILPNLPKLMAAYFELRFLGSASGLYAATSLVGVGIILTATASILIPITGSWRNVALFLGALELGLAVVWWLKIGLGRIPQSTSQVTESSSATGTANVPPMFSDLRLWLAGGLLFFENSLFYGFVGWLPTFLEVKGFDQISAANFAALLPFFGAAAILGVSYLSYKTRSRRPILVGSVGASVASVSLMLVAAPALLPLPIAAVGASLNVWWVICLILPADISPPESVGKVAGVVFSIGYAGGLIGPWLLGYLFDLTGRTETGLSAFLVLAAIGLVLAFMVPRDRRTK